MTQNSHNKASIQQRTHDSCKKGKTALREEGGKGMEGEGGGGGTCGCHSATSGHVLGGQAGPCALDVDDGDDVDGGGRGQHRHAGGLHDHRRSRDVDGNRDDHDHYDDHHRAQVELQPVEDDLAAGGLGGAQGPDVEDDVQDKGLRGVHMSKSGQAQCPAYM